jgi:hypothetical protein
MCAKSIWCSKATNKKTHIAMSQIQSPCDAMCDNPFIVHEFFCAQKRGTRRSAKREQTRIVDRRGAQVASRSRSRIFRSYVTIMQQIDCNPQFGLRELSAPARKNLFLLQFRNLVREPRDFSARRIAMHDALLRGANQSRLGFCHSCGRSAAIASGNRLLDLTDRGAHARTPRFINDGSARGLAGGFLCRFRIRHTCWTQEMVTESAAYRVLARYRQRRRSKGRQGGAGGAAARLVSRARIRRRV